MKPLFCSLLLLTLLGCAAESPAPSAESSTESEPTEVDVPEPEDGPRLILLLVVDQMRGDYLDHFAPVLDGGLLRLAEDGTNFVDAHHGHSETKTAPGHASLSTGVHPRRHGIISNDWYSRAENEEINCVEDAEHGKSPARMEASSLGDWIKELMPSAKVFGVSRKDRGAIFPAGREADAAYWYSRVHGGFQSSTWYQDETPEWVDDFNQARHLDVHFGTTWETPLADAVPASTRDALGIQEMDFGVFHQRLPRAYGGAALKPGASFYDALTYTPHTDEQITRFAKRLIVEEGLGEDGYPDVLALSYSAMDSAGHQYGPQSPEVLEVVLGLDRTLADLFAFVDEKIGLDRTLIALSSDHGAVEVPEHRIARGEDGDRLDVEDYLCVQQTDRVLRERFGDGSYFFDGLVLDRENLEARGLDPDLVADAAAEHLRSCDFITQIWTRKQLADEAILEEPYGELYYNSFHPENSPDLMWRSKEHYLHSSRQASSHGTAYAYDTHVPLVIAAPDCKPQQVAERAWTVDLAPTLASLAGVAPPEGLDGVDRSSVVCP